MKRNPSDPYEDEADAERGTPPRIPWSIITLGVGLAIAMVALYLGVF